MNRQADDHLRLRVIGVLNRNWIDLDRTSVICAQGQVSLCGELRRKGPTDSMGPRSVQHLERELTETRGVRRVDLALENYVRTKEGGWRKK